jgi:hypothetical protein
VSTDRDTRARRSFGTDRMKAFSDGVPGGVRTAQRFARLGLIDEYVLQSIPSPSAQANRCSPTRPNCYLPAPRPTTPGSSGSDTRPAATRPQQLTTPDRNRLLPGRSQVLAQNRGVRDRPMNHGGQARHIPLHNWPVGAPTYPRGDPPAQGQIRRSDFIDRREHRPRRHPT